MGHRLPGKVRVVAARLFVLLGHQLILLPQVAVVAVATDRQVGLAAERLAAGPHLVEPRLRVV